MYRNPPRQERQILLRVGFRASEEAHWRSALPEAERSPIVERPGFLLELLHVFRSFSSSRLGPLQACTPTLPAYKESTAPSEAPARTGASAYLHNPPKLARILISCLPGTSQELRKGDGRSTVVLRREVLGEKLG